MATLVQFLAAGVNGAASGSATFLLRGTASSAQSVMYNEFEGLTQPATNVVTLDSNGAAEVYVEAYVDVEIRNSAGTTLRTVTVGNSAPLVEVQSTSFKGTDYDGSPANTVGEPITLKAILDKWITSAGAADWQVLFNGVATNLQSAIAGFAGIFVNVKDPAYGAVGDGVTDDTTAITAAAAAAGGGVVFFPAGTYKVTTLALSGSNINWWGAGNGASIISGTTGTQLVSLTNNTNTAWKNFRGLSFTSAGAYDRLFLLEESQNASFVGCSFDASQCSADVVNAGATAGLSKFVFTDCDFTLGASTQRGLYNSAATGARQFSVKGSNFKVPSGFTGSMIVGPDFMVDTCRFDASLVTSGAYYHIDAVDATVAGKYVGNFSDNKFLDGGSSGYAFKLTSVKTSSEFSEDDNTFIGFTAPADLTDPGHIYDCSNDAAYDETSRIVLGSRRGKQLSFTTTGSGTLSNTRCWLVAETVSIRHQFAGNCQVINDPSDSPTGLKWSVAVFNDSGGARNVVFTGQSQTDTDVTVAALADQGWAFANFFTYRRFSDAALVPGEVASASTGITHAAN
jgi:hypothetical protein